MRYWITNPDLSPDHDHQIEAEALSDWSRSGWRIREDQADPVDPDLAEALAAAEAERAAAAEAADDGEHETETPAADVEPDENDDDTEEGS